MCQFTHPYCVFWAITKIFIHVLRMWGFSFVFWSQTFNNHTANVLHVSKLFGSRYIFRSFDFARCYRSLKFIASERLMICNSWKKRKWLGELFISESGVLSCDADDLLWMFGKRENGLLTDELHHCLSHFHTVLHYTFLLYVFLRFGKLYELWNGPLRLFQSPLWWKKLTNFTLKLMSPIRKTSVALRVFLCRKSIKELWTRHLIIIPRNFCTIFRY